MRATVLCGDQWHPCADVRGGLAPLEAAGFAWDWVEDALSWSRELPSTTPVLVLAKANQVSEHDRTPWVTPEIEQALQAFVRRGGGLLAVHAGTAGYESTPGLRALLGGVFVKHPPRCLVTVEPKPGHPLTKGAGAFTSVDEHYFMALDDAKADVFATTRSEHGEQPGGWTRGEGAGRVCVLIPGHTVDVWLQPGFQVLLERALLWCAGGALP